MRPLRKLLGSTLLTLTTLIAPLNPAKAEGDVIFADGFEQGTFDAWNMASGTTILPATHPHELPVASYGGLITSDTSTGCREVSALGPLGTLFVKACALPDDEGNPPQFDAQVITRSEGVQIAFGPVVVGDPTIDGIDNGVNYAIGDLPTTIEPSFLRARHLQGWPLEHNTILSASTPLFTPDAYRFDFGDGTALPASDGIEFHTYPASGTYWLQVDATDAFGHEASLHKRIAITAPIGTVDPAFPFSARVIAGERTDGQYRLTCETYGFRTDTRSWTIDDVLDTDASPTITRVLPAGDHVVSCEADIPEGLGFVGTVSDERAIRVGAPVTSPDTTLPDGVIGYFSFNGDLNDRIAGYNGAAQGSAGFVPGRAGEAISFSDGRVESFRPVGGVRSLAFWANLAENGGTLADMHGLRVESLADGRFRIVGTDAVGNNAIMADSYTSFPPSEWHQIALVKEEGSYWSPFRLYVDGTHHATLPGIGHGFPVGEHLWLGNGEFGSPIAGTIDEVVLWDRSLSPEEIRELYNDGATNTYPFGSPIPVPTACYSDVLTMPATSNGSIASDTVSAGCRHVRVESGANSLDAKICPEAVWWPTSFQMFTENTTGSGLTLTLVNETLDPGVSAYHLGVLPQCDYD